MYSKDAEAIEGCSNEPRLNMAAANNTLALTDAELAEWRGIQSHAELRGSMVGLVGWQRPSGNLDGKRLEFDVPPG